MDNLKCHEQRIFDGNIDDVSKPKKMEMSVRGYKKFLWMNIKKREGFPFLNFTPKLKTNVGFQRNT